MKISIIIVTWNVCDEILTCLHSIEENPPAYKYEVLVVDNSSKDDTVREIRDNFPGISLIINESNLGFAAANNIGLLKSQGELILFLNPDTIIKPNSLDALIALMDKNEDIGVCSPKLLNPDGSLQESVRGFPTFRAALHRHTAFKYLYVFKGMYKKWLMKDQSYEKLADVDQVMGAALITRKSILELVGPMDEQFFMYYEEVDLCYRIKKAGWRVVYAPQSEIIHIGGSSSGQIPAGKRIMALTSLLKFFKKHRGVYLTCLFSLIFKPALLIRDIIEMSSSMIKYIYWAVVFNKIERNKSAKRIKITCELLSKYSWFSLFKV